MLGVESVPDGLAAGLLAGVNPLAGLYAYLFGTIGGSLFTSSAFMAVQATGAMAIIIADVPVVHSADDPARALFTLSVLTGVVMLAAGFLRLGYGQQSFSYGTFAGSATARKGLTDALTVEAHGEFSPHLAMLGGGPSFSVGSFGSIP